jgi:hypothetical protein
VGSWIRHTRDDHIDSGKFLQSRMNPGDDRRLLGVQSTVRRSVLLACREYSKSARGRGCGLRNSGSSRCGSAESASLLTVSVVTLHNQNTFTSNQQP